MPKSSKTPIGWLTVRVDEAGLVRLGRQRSPDKHTGQHATKYVRAANITPDGLNLDDLLEMDFTPVERAVFALQVGDVLLTEASGSAAQVGRSALWRGEIEGCCYQNTVIRFRPHVTAPEYALVVFRQFAASGIFARAARGVGIQHLGATRFAELGFPLPPMEEQRRIADVAQRRLAEIREAEGRLRSALDHLRDQVREILAAAVAGELVTQPAKSRVGQVSTRAHSSDISLSGSDIGPRQKTLFDSIDPPTRDDPPISEPLPAGWIWVRVDEAAK